MKRYWFLLCVAVFLIVGVTVSAKENRTVIIAVGDKEFEIVLADNEAADKFYQMLPMSLNMSELNGNEKYYYMDERLQTSASVPDRIHTGDLMLYGSNCVVLFYKSFSTSYSYTELGHMANSSGLAGTLGNGDVTVTFSKKDNTEGETGNTVENSPEEKSSLEESSPVESFPNEHSHTYEWQITKYATAMQYVSFPKKVYEKLEERGDLTLEINFVYLGNTYTVILPPNADFSELID